MTGTGRDMATPTGSLNHRSYRSHRSDHCIFSAVLRTVFGRSRTVNAGVIVRIKTRVVIVSNRMANAPNDANDESQLSCFRRSHTRAVFHAHTGLCKNVQYPKVS
jgi:hypothetical protein